MPKVALVVVAKLTSSALLICATSGSLLWRETARANPFGLVDLPKIFPDWLALSAGGWIPNVVEQARILSDSPYAFVAYIAAQLFFLLTIFAVPFIPSWGLRALLSVPLCVGVAYDLSMISVGGHFPTYATTNTMLDNLHVGMRGTISAYVMQAVPGLALAGAALVAFLWNPPMVRARGLVGLTAASLALIAFILFRTDGFTSAFPSPVTSYINAYKSMRNSADQPIEPVSYTGPIQRHFKNIVLIVDESVRGDFVSLNNATIGTTPFLLAEANNIVNFGIASSGANCSTEARLIVRFGIRSGELGVPWVELRRHPPFWLYARYAGFETVHFDAQGSANKYDSGMTSTEAKLVDRRLLFNQMPMYVRDGEIAKTLRNVLKEPGAKFILVDKLGVHAPYDRMYPPSAAVWPAAEGQWSSLEKMDVINHYRNAIRWSVDDFFRVLLADGLQDTLLLYTSDHGQSFEATSRWPHCNSAEGAVRSEAAVPLFAISTDEKWAAMLGASAIVNFDKASHFEVFPTLLLAMGYDEGWVERKMGPSLLGPITRQQKRRFWAGGALLPYED